MLKLNTLLSLLILTLIFPLIFLNGWLAFQFFKYFQPLITTLILATLLAFILDYPVSVLEQRGVNRNFAVILVFFTSVIILASLGITLAPIILEQFHEMVKLLPQWINASQQKLQMVNHWAVSHRVKVNFSQLLTQLSARFPDELENITDKLFSIVLDTIDSISEFLLTVVLTFYLLLDGERLWQGIFNKLPWNFGKKLQQSIQQNFQNYLIGQLALALLMGVSLTILFVVLQVRFALLFGLGVGLLSLIPFGDVVSLAVVTLITASHDIWLAAKLVAIAVVIDQTIDQAVAPKLLGNLTGLRPIWVLISLFVGTYIGGVLGLLIAVPVAGVIKDALDGWEVTMDEELPDTLTNESTL